MTEEVSGFGVLSGLLAVSFRVGRVVFLPSALNYQKGFDFCKKGQIFFLLLRSRNSKEEERVRKGFWLVHLKVPACSKWDLMSSSTS